MNSSRVLLYKYFNDHYVACDRSISSCKFAHEKAPDLILSNVFASDTSCPEYVLVNPQAIITKNLVLLSQIGICKPFFKSTEQC